MSHDLNMCEGYINKDITDKHEHYTKDGKRESLRIIVKVSSDVPIIQSYKCINVLFFYVDVIQFSNFDKELCLFLFSKRLVNNHIFNIFLFFSFQIIQFFPLSWLVI